MPKEMTGNRHRQRPGWYLLLLHGTCFLLVAVYVNMFQFWAWLSKELEYGLVTKILPVIVTLSVLAGISLRFIQRINQGYRIKLIFLGLGLVGAFLALAIPDPNVPIKRIHVAEYILLSFLVRYTLSHRYEGVRLVVFTILVTALYGVHDEMLQGLHSLRYYGWRDIIVNAVAGLSGAFLGHGLVCFEGRTENNIPCADHPVPPLQALFFACLFGLIIWQVIYLFHHRESVFSIYTMAPIAACCLFIGLLFPKTVFNSDIQHGFQAIFWLGLGLIGYPIIAGLSGMEFL